MGKKKLTAIILAGLMALGFTTLAGQDVATSKAAESLVLIDEDMELEELIVNEGTAITIAEGVTVTISGNFTFDNCDFTMEDGASLTVHGTMSNAGDGTVTIGEGATLTMGSSTTTPSVEALLLGYTYTAATDDEGEIVECTGEVTFTNNGTVNIYCASLINGTSTNNGTIYTNSRCNSGNKTYAVYKMAITGYNDNRSEADTLQYQPTYFAGVLTNYGTITAGTRTSLVIDTDYTYNYGTIETTCDGMTTNTPEEMRGLQLGGYVYNYEGASIITRSCAFYKVKIYNWGYLAIIGATLSSSNYSKMIECSYLHGNYIYTASPILDSVSYEDCEFIQYNTYVAADYSYNEELVTDSSAIEFKAEGGGKIDVPDAMSDHYSFVRCARTSEYIYKAYVTETDALAELGLTISAVYYINSSGEKVYFDYGEISLYTGVYSASSDGYETKDRYYCVVDTIEPMNAIIEVSCTGDHSWDAGVITTAPTCEAEGVRTYSCTKCDATKEESVPATGHSYNSGVVTKAATTTSTGVMTYTCTACGSSYTDVIAMLSSSSSSSGTASSSGTSSSSGTANGVTVAVGDIIKDSAGNKYEVTAVGDNPTVRFKKVSSTLKGKLNIKATVTINGVKYKITAIAANACKGNKKITSVVIGKNVKKIGKKAFYKCTKLKKVTIKSKKLTKSSVGKKAFGKTPKTCTFKSPKKKKALYKTILTQKAGASKKATFK